MLKGRKYPVEVLTTEEVQRIIQSFSSCPSGRRNAALVTVLWRGGLRISEALGLVPKDIEQDGTLRILTGKSCRVSWISKTYSVKPRTIAMDSMTMVILNRWLESRKKLGISDDAPVFCTLEGRPIFYTYPGQMLWRVAKQCGIKKRVHPHAFRHSFATSLMEEGCDVGLISKALGHSSIGNTSVYLDHVSPKRVTDTMRARKWYPMIGP